MSVITVLSRSVFTLSFDVRHISKCLPSRVSSYLVTVKLMYTTLYTASQLIPVNCSSQLQEATVLGSSVGSRPQPPPPPL